MKILVTGVSVRAMAESAVRSGYRVVALDAFGDRDLKNIAETYSLRRDFQAAYSPGNLYRAGRQLLFDTVAYTSNLENYPEIIDRFGRHREIIGNARQAVAAVRYWPELFEKLQCTGFFVPQTVFKDEFLPAESECRWLLKPFLSGGGHGIRYCIPQREIPLGNMDRYKAGEFMLQEHIPGRSCSAAFVANGENSVVLGIAEQLIGVRAFGAAEFIFCGNLLPLSEMCDPYKGRKILDEIRRLANFLSREFGLSGVNGIDFILRDGQVYLTEVNPRYSASMELMEIAYGLPIFHIHLQSVLNSELPEFDLELEGPCRTFYGKSYLYAEKDLTMPSTERWAERGFRDVPESGERILKGGPICTIGGEGSTRRRALAAMTDQAEKLKEEIYG